MDQQNDNQCKKKNTLLNTDVSNVFVVKNAKRRAFIEQFSYASINFTQKDLGTILGFFIVRDHSTTSENIVNFLASEIKKHYFSSNPKPIEEKFESTLHHINRALEELANIGNVDWLGTIDGAVCAIDDKSIHFSVTGNATILLLRNNMLLNITEGIASPEAADYPLKTFADISSGEMCVHDKIIITSQELLELVSIEELQKNANRMGQRNFLQFIETVLTNECAIASTTIIDVTEKEQLTSTTSIDQAHVKPLPKNFFGAATLEQKNADSVTFDAPINIDELTQEDPKEYTDPRTGHIHIHGSDDVPQKAHPLDAVSDFLSDMRETFTETAKKQKRSFSKKISSFKKSDPVSDVEILPLKEEVEPSPVADEQPSIQPTLPKIKEFTGYAVRFFSTVKELLQRTFAKITSWLHKIIRRERPQEELVSTENFVVPQYTQTSSKKRFLPDMHRIAFLWHSMEQKTKMLTIGVIVAIVVIPMIIKIIPSKDVARDASQNTASQDSATTTQQEPEMTTQNTAPTPSTEPDATLANPNTLLTSDMIQFVITLDTIVIGVEKNALSILSQSEKPKTTLPADAGSVIFATPMQDLNMIFIITDKDHMYTFSPASPKFVRQEKIPTIDHKKIKSIGTFMTYLYIVDDKMIRRHARIENGFDDGKDWLKKSTDLNTVTSMTIGESIYITQGPVLHRFTQGNTDTISLDASITNPNILFTTAKTDFLWIIDTANKTLYKVDNKDHKVREKYVHENFAQATSLSINESSQTAYISTKNSILSYSLKK